jgi:hypothetical protein
MQCEGFDGPCKRTDATKNGQMTQYAPDNEKVKMKFIINGNLEFVNKANYATLCPACQEQADEYWKEMWAEYRSSVL